MNKKEAISRLESVMTNIKDSNIKNNRIEKLMVTYKHYESHTLNQLK